MPSFRLIVAYAFVLCFASSLHNAQAATCFVGSIDYSDSSNATQGYQLGPDCPIPNHANGQTFQAPFPPSTAPSIRLKSVTWTLFYEQAGTTSGLVTRLYKYSPKSLPGTLLWTSAQTSIARSSDYSFTKAVFVLPSKAGVLTSGDSYLFTLAWTAGVTTGCGYLVKRPSGSTYSGGVEVDELNNDWVARPGYENPCFKADFDTYPCSDNSLSQSDGQSTSSSSDSSASITAPVIGGVVGVVAAVALIVAGVVATRRRRAAESKVRVISVTPSRRGAWGEAGSTGPAYSTGRSTVALS
mmetsp:Transcript_45578/g.74267  ORF Transcript_45578/g.74267 Transcript_45578/m.74267 type:complete len:298 (+) Transcript_45578:95-988(+)|eukprot:CAMPEP_0184658752 /NCGR_PEP_ID=MMETSP0308-20130426/26756_1 /TAXON_ID=38269 /ORGANISM="Gloeochaete witrockiana, Strain SAG 46.84" /LENGTH=297 /DNA_ID=CAMNT_0027097981 /DNA_START=84 /DNA_END=977 /DNA_ORIENTATION=+